MWFNHSFISTLLLFRSIAAAETIAVIEVPQFSEVHTNQVGLKTKTRAKRSSNDRRPSEIIYERARVSKKQKNGPSTVKHYMITQSPLSERASGKEELRALLREREEVIRTLDSTKKALMNEIKQKDSMFNKQADLNQKSLRNITGLVEGLSRKMGAYKERYERIYDELNVCHSLLEDKETETNAKLQSAQVTGKALANRETLLSDRETDLLALVAILDERESNLQKREEYLSERENELQRIGASNPACHVHVVSYEKKKRSKLFG